MSLFKRCKHKWDTHIVGEYDSIAGPRTNFVSICKECGSIREYTRRGEAHLWEKIG